MNFKLDFSFEFFPVEIQSKNTTVQIVKCPKKVFLIAADFTHGSKSAHLKSIPKTEATSSKPKSVSQINVHKLTQIDC